MKFSEQVDAHQVKGVTLRVRVWIEIVLVKSLSPCILVTLRVRVWIEIPNKGRKCLFKRSHPPCEGVD